MKKLIFVAAFVIGTGFSFETLAQGSMDHSQVSGPWSVIDDLIHPATEAAAVGRACRASTDCLPNENCIGGSCELIGGGGNCLSDTDCGVGEHCVAGRCAR